MLVPKFTLGKPMAMLAPKFTLGKPMAMLVPTWGDSGLLCSTNWRAVKFTPRNTTLVPIALPVGEQWRFTLGNTTAVWAVLPVGEFTLGELDWTGLFYQVASGRLSARVLENHHLLLVHVVCRHSEKIFCAMGHTCGGCRANLRARVNPKICDVNYTRDIILSPKVSNLCRDLFAVGWRLSVVGYSKYLEGLLFSVVKIQRG